jgi:hypothetical protein
MTHAFRATVCALALTAAGCGSAGDGASDQAGERENDATTAAEAAPGNNASKGALPTIYYGGVSSQASTDGKFLGASEALIKRVLDRQNGTIIDSVLKEKRLVQVVFRPTANSNVLSVEHGDGSYSGTLTFTPDPWSATEWTYDLRVRDGTSIEGTGKDNGEALLIEQYVVGADGQRQIQIVERLPRIKQSTYDAKRKALVR